jgi:hypothetical protein
MSAHSVASNVNTILRTGLIAGTLDILSAITVYALIMGKGTPVQILQGVASGVFGREAFAGGFTMALTGLLFHYAIALIFTTVYFLLYPHLPFLHRQWAVSGVLFGVLVWLVMNLAVLPLSNFQQAPLRWAPALLGMAIIVVMIGLPIAFFTQKNYN